MSEYRFVLEIQAEKIEEGKFRYENDGRTYNLTSKSPDSIEIGDSVKIGDLIGVVSDVQLENLFYGFEVKGFTIECETP